MLKENNGGDLWSSTFYSSLVGPQVNLITEQNVKKRMKKNQAAILLSSWSPSWSSPWILAVTLAVILAIIICCSSCCCT